MKSIRCIGGCLLGVVLALIATTTKPRDAAARKMIICMIDDIKPVAIIGADGGEIEITVGGTPTAVENGTVVQFTLTVEQKASGATGVGRGIAPRPGPHDPLPEEMTFTQKVHALGGTRFVEGPAIATYVAEEIRNGKVVRSWSRTKDITLKKETPTLKGPINGKLQFDPDGSGFASFSGVGNLNLMGPVAVQGEFLFVPGDEPGTAVGVGIAAFVTLDGEILVASVKWLVDADGNGALEFRWPGKITFSDGTVVESTERFAKLPFGGLRGTSTVTKNGDWGDGNITTNIKMTGEIVDPDPLD